MPTLQADGSVDYRLNPNSVYVSLDQHPLGTQSGENFSVPSNYRIPPARIYVVNHSRTRKWKRTIEAVSTYRGAEEVLIKDKKLQSLYNADMMYKQVEKGRDMNLYAEEVKPVVWKLDIPGRDPVTGEPACIYVPPAHPDTPDRLIMVEVPEGTWDLYLGNYERMQGYSGMKPRAKEGEEFDPRSHDKFDQRVKMQEQQAINLRWSRRHNPVFRITDDGQVEERNNPFGVLEFIRESQRAVKQPLDREYLTALDLVESA